MSPSDKAKGGNSSNTGEEQAQACLNPLTMGTTSDMSSTSTSDKAKPGTISSIPMITASLTTLKCSDNDQIKTFDPGEEGGIERLTHKHSGNSVVGEKSSCSGLIKSSNKNYKAGSKINKLADMLAKRSQNIVEVTQNNKSNLIADITIAPKTEDTVNFQNTSDAVTFDKILNNSTISFKKTVESNELGLFRRSRRKSVPNHSCNLNQLHLQSTSKSCLDFSKLFFMQEDGKPELNALGETLNKLQTDESTKRKANKKTFKNVELTQILPEKKKRFLFKNENLAINKVNEKVEISTKVEMPFEEENESRENSNRTLTSSMSSMSDSISSTNSKKEGKVKQRKSKRLVETSTQTADIEFITVMKTIVNSDSSVTEDNEKLKECAQCKKSFRMIENNKSNENSKHTNKCQFCAKKLPSPDELQVHYEKKHPNKNMYCKKCEKAFLVKEDSLPSSDESHLDKDLEENSQAVCNDVVDSAQENKKNEGEPKQSEKKNSRQNLNKTDLIVDVTFDVNKKSSTSPKVVQKCSPKEANTEEQLLEMEMLFYSHLSGNIQENLKNHLDGKVNQHGCPIQIDNEEGTIDNLLAKVKGSHLLPIPTSSAGTSDFQMLRASSPYKTRSKTPIPLPQTAKKFKKLPNWQQKFWEKYNFPTNYRYEHKFWDKNYLNSEKSAFYLKDLSCLDIKTQLIMKENIKKLENVRLTEEDKKPIEILKFPECLSLVPLTSGTNHEKEKFDFQGKRDVTNEKEECEKSFKLPETELPVIKSRRKLSSDISSQAKKQQTDKVNFEKIKMTTRRQSSLDSAKDEIEENSKKRKGSLDLSLSQKMSLRRQSSLDIVQKNNDSNTDKNDKMVEVTANTTNDDTALSTVSDFAEISGEWVRPRSYLCGTCCTKFTNLWELEDHKWVNHPNVWCTHYEFEDEKIDKLFYTTENENRETNSNDVSNVKLTDLYKRYLLPRGSLKTAKLVPILNFPEQCTKCQKSCMNLSEMHKHMLDCGGDTKWFLTMYSSPMTIKRKWRPFGSRRRKQIGRRDLKRNIPNTPNIRTYHYQHRIRTKPGDVETIQKMLANLPEKRARRAINFDEIKTRSQATIHSNRLLRKRFKSSFTNNLLKLKSFKQRHQIKSAKKDSNSKSASDTSSENTPMGSPKRKNKVKENLLNTKDESIADISNDSTNDSVTKKRGSSKKGDCVNSPPSRQKFDLKKDKNQKVSSYKNVKIDKSATKRKCSLSVSALVDKTRKKASLISTANPTPTTGTTINTQEKHEKDEGPLRVRKKTKRNLNKNENNHINNEVSNGLNVSEYNFENIKRRKKLKNDDKGKITQSNDLEKKNEWLNVHSKTILRLNCKSKEKTEIIRKMKKKYRNSKRIIETKKNDTGNRRSLRLKSIQGPVCSHEIAEELDKGCIKVSENTHTEKVLNSTSSITHPKNFLVLKPNELGDKKKLYREIKKEDNNSDITRRSSRSFTMKESFQKTEKKLLITSSVDVTEEIGNTILGQKNSKNCDDDIKTIKAEINPDTSFLNTQCFQNSKDQNDKFEDRNLMLVRNERSTEKFSEFNSSKTFIRKDYKKNLAQLKQFKGSDLEEMPILAKEEPIRGKFDGKTEKDIPILMPVVEESREIEQTNSKEQNFNFQIIKKRKKAPKKVAPLKIVKKIDPGFSKHESSMAFALEGRKSESRMEKPTTSPSIKKYFLGICPCEIDKGREDGNDESGSDSEPLIMLINQSQKGSNATLENEIQNNSHENEKQRKQEGEVEVNFNDETDENKKRLNSAPDISILSTLDENNKSDLSTKIKNKYKPKLKIAPRLKTKVEDKKKKIKKRRIKKTDVDFIENEPILKVVKPSSPIIESNEDIVKEFSPYVEEKESVFPERRSRRISKETKLTNEFIIDDPLILVDELWSDLDSDSDSAKKKAKKGKKKLTKRKCIDEKKNCDVNLEELLRNFGENKELGSCKKGEAPLLSALPFSPPIVLRTKIVYENETQSIEKLRRALECRITKESYRRLSLKLFQFNKTYKNFGNRGEKLSNAKKVLREKQDRLKFKSNTLPDLPFLTAEIKENPVQVIQCGSQKPKSGKKKQKKTESKHNISNIQLKISLPLESLNNMAVFNNNHLTEFDIEKQITQITKEEVYDRNIDGKEIEDDLIEKDKVVTEEEFSESGEVRSKIKRSDVIDKIFYCEICKTYYYSSSQLKIHKLSNRHKLKESELLLRKQKLNLNEVGNEDKIENIAAELYDSMNTEAAMQNVWVTEDVNSERINEDTLEMPILEGPFIENPLTRNKVEAVSEPILQPDPSSTGTSNFNFSQESLKDIQRAIGCTDEEMLILTLLGENTIEIENDILSFDGCESGGEKSDKITSEKSKKDIEKPNGIFKVDLKQRMTSALANLVNKAVFNLLQKYESLAKTSVNPEAVSLLGKLSNLSRRKSNLQLTDLFKKKRDGESSVSNLYKGLKKKEPTVSYKFQCTICGSRFEKASTWECHISRSHNGKAKKFAEVHDAPTGQEDEWHDFWEYDTSDEPMGETSNLSQFWCSDCGINFISPQEVLEHQKIEHQAGVKTSKDAGPLQSSTIGSSDEILEGKKIKRRSKIFSSEELDQQRIIANNELRKLDRKFLGKNKSNKIKWGVDALRFTVEKENKTAAAVEEEKEAIEGTGEREKSQKEYKNIDVISKLNFSQNNSIPEFKVIQKNCLKNRFQKIIDNKLKRKSNRSCPPEADSEDMETEVMLVPVVVKKKSKKQKSSKCKKSEGGKNLDIYDFNDSEPENEPVVLSHIKKPTAVPTKLKLVKIKEGPSKNKADSTTKDLVPDDYDSEDSLPLSIVKKYKPGEEDDEKDEKTSEDGVEKSEGILEQVEYLIEQLENETGSTKIKSEEKEEEKGSAENFEKNYDREEKDEFYEEEKNELDKEEKYKSEKEANIKSPQESLRISLASKLLEFQTLPLRGLKSVNDDENLIECKENNVETKNIDKIIAEPESSLSTFDEEDSMPLVMISKKKEVLKTNENEKIIEENTPDISSAPSEDINVAKTETSAVIDVSQCSSPDSQPNTEENSMSLFFNNENNSCKTKKSFETLNGNITYCRNESMNDYDSDINSHDNELIDSYNGKLNSEENSVNLIKEVTEKEDIVIVCSKGGEKSSEVRKVGKKKIKVNQKRKKENFKCLRKKKKRFPLLSATIEENNFRNTESTRLNKEVIVRRIWNRKKLVEDSNYEENTLMGTNNNIVSDTIHNEESQTEVEKEIIVKKIWSRKKLDYENEYFDKSEEKLGDQKINKTEVSDEIIIKCGPKTVSSPKRRKSRSSTNESSKETIMRKIWSGKCKFQTKAALKTYDSDVLLECKENEMAGEQVKPKKRGRPAGFSSTKRIKLDNEDKNDEDDLDSLLEEIEREQLEKAIRLEFLLLRRSEKANVETWKEKSDPTVGLFKETSDKHKKETAEKKRKKVRGNLSHARQSLLKRKNLLRKPVRRVLPHAEERYFNEKPNRTSPVPETDRFSHEKSENIFKSESKVKSRKHKKHRHKHHHHKHKHKKSKHHKCILGKHKSSRYQVSGEGGEENTDSFTILKKICQEIPNEIESAPHHGKNSNSSVKNDDVTMSPFSIEENTKDGEELNYESEVSNKKSFLNRGESVYEFIEDGSDFSSDGNNLRG